MAGSRLPGPTALDQHVRRFGYPATYTLGSGFARPLPTDMGPPPGGVVEEAAVGGIEDYLHEQAKSLVRDFAERIGPGAFSLLDRRQVAAGLLARIDDPSVIQQGPTQFCGPGSFIFALASDDPLRYVRFAIELYEMGKASLGKLLIEPDDEVVHSSPPSAEIEPVDWMVLASVRDWENWFFDVNTGESIVRAGTNPHEVAKWFRQAGYSNVVEDVNTVFKKDLANARTASDFFEQGYKVVIYLGFGIFEPGGSGTHFVVLTSRINLVPSNVFFDVFTWGEGHHHVPKSGVLTLPNFLKDYYGYIAAKL